jgi:hypothetical protein
MVDLGKDAGNWDTSLVKERMEIYLFLRPIEITIFPGPLILPYHIASPIL